MFKKILIGIIILVTLFQVFSPYAFAVEIESAEIKFTGRTAPKTLLFRRPDGSTGSITCSIVGYWRNNKFYPAYCLDGGFPGAETQEYSVNISNYIQDVNCVVNNEKVWRIATNGFPYNNMGLSDDEAYLVTKIAIYCVTGNADFGVYTYDSARPETVNTYNALKHLVTEVAEDTTIQRQTGTIAVNKIGGLVEFR